MAGHTEVRRLDLADLASVRAFAAGWTEPLDYLINNAGIMRVPQGRPYRSLQAHCDSKLANLLFTLDLQHRLTEAGRGVQAVAAHPGIATTNLTSHIRGIRGTLGRAFKHLFNDAERGALPTLYAATQDVPGACYVGPDGPGHLRGYPELGTQSKGRGTPSSHAGYGTFRPASLSRCIETACERRTSGPGMCVLPPAGLSARHATPVPATADAQRRTA
jgi:hypothetical protein